MTPFAVRALHAEEHALSFEQRTQNLLAASCARNAADSFRAAARLALFSRDDAARWYRLGLRALRRARWVEARRVPYTMEAVAVDHRAVA